jgi:hypothetical protein
LLKIYSLEEVRAMGVPAYHPERFWYDPVAPRSRQLAFFFGSRDCWCEYCRGSATLPGT